VTLQRSTTRCNTAQHSTTQRSTLLRSTRHGAMQHDTVQHSATLLRATHRALLQTCNALQHVIHRGQVVPVGATASRSSSTPCDGSLRRGRRTARATGRRRRCTLRPTTTPRRCTMNTANTAQHMITTYTPYGATQYSTMQYGTMCAQCCKKVHVQRGATQCNKLQRNTACCTTKYQVATVQHVATQCTSATRPPLATV
jgi:hypothetical protein